MDVNNKKLVESILKTGLSNDDAVETLVGLGYKKAEARAAVNAIRPPEPTKPKQRVLSNSEARAITGMFDAEKAEKSKAPTSALTDAKSIEKMAAEVKKLRDALKKRNEALEPEKVAGSPAVPPSPVEAPARDRGPEVRTTPRLAVDNTQPEPEKPKGKGWVRRAGRWTFDKIIAPEIHHQFGELGRAVTRRTRESSDTTRTKVSGETSVEPELRRAKRSLDGAGDRIVQKLEETKEIVRRIAELEKERSVEGAQVAAAGTAQAGASVGPTVRGRMGKGALVGAGLAVAGGAAAYGLARRAEPVEKDKDELPDPPEPREDAGRPRGDDTEVKAEGKDLKFEADEIRFKADKIDFGQNGLFTAGAAVPGAGGTAPGSTAIPAPGAGGLSPPGETPGGGGGGGAAGGSSAGGRGAAGSPGSAGSSGAAGSPGGRDKAAGVGGRAPDVPTAKTTPTEAPGSLGPAGSGSRLAAQKGLTQPPGSTPEDMSSTLFGGPTAENLPGTRAPLAKTPSPAVPVAPGMGPTTSPPGTGFGGDIMGGDFRTPGSTRVAGNLDEMKGAEGGMTGGMALPAPPLPDLPKTRGWLGQTDDTDRRDDLGLQRPPAVPAPASTPGLDMTRGAEGGMMGGMALPGPALPDLPPTKSLLDSFSPERPAGYGEPKWNKTSDVNRTFFDPTLMQTAPRTVGSTMNQAALMEPDMDDWSRGFEKKGADASTSSSFTPASSNKDEPDPPPATSRKDHFHEDYPGLGGQVRSPHTGLGD